MDESIIFIFCLWAKLTYLHTSECDYKIKAVNIDMMQSYYLIAVLIWICINIFYNEIILYPSSHSILWNPFSTVYLISHDMSIHESVHNKL